MRVSISRRSSSSALVAAVAYLGAASPTSDSPISEVISEMNQPAPQLNSPALNSLDINSLTMPVIPSPVKTSASSETPSTTAFPTDSSFEIYNAATLNQEKSLEYDGKQIARRFNNLSAQEMVRRVEQLTPEELKALSQPQKLEIYRMALKVDPLHVHMRTLVVPKEQEDFDALLQENGTLLYQGPLDRKLATVSVTATELPFSIVVRDDSNVIVAAPAEADTQQGGYTFSARDDSENILIEGALHATHRGILLDLRWWNGRGIWRIEAWQGRDIGQEPVSIMPRIEAVLSPH